MDCFVASLLAMTMVRAGGCFNDPKTLRTAPTRAFLGGDTPNYADYIVFGPFQWARVVSPFKLLAEEDPIYAWREKLLDAFDGMARKSPGYQV